MLDNMYVLDDDNNVCPVTSREEYLEFFESDKRTLQWDKFNEVTLSTVFLMLDYGFINNQILEDGEKYKPLIFETMIFGGEHDGFLVRYNDYQQALSYHKLIKEALLNEIQGKPSDKTLPELRKQLKLTS